MTRFASTVVCIMVMASSSWSDALRIPETLNDAVNKETMRIPKLRKLDAERKNVMQKKLAGMAVKPSEVEKRRLVNDDKTNYAVDYSWDQYTDQQEVGFDITNYAVKYTSCATVQTYSDDLALDETIDTVLAAKRFAMFRLCPVNQCSSYSSNGCGSNYGEYLVALDQFLLAMLEYQESRVAGYCDYCQTCATIEAAKRFWTEVYTTRTTALASAQTAYETWYTSYLQTYQNNNNGYQQGDTITAAQQYYQNVRDSNNYANQYVATTNGNSGSSSGSSSSSSSSSSGSTTSAYGSSSSQYQWSNQNMWEYQNTQNRVSSSSNVWSNMGTAGTFYGRPILNGYYDNGEFVQEYGYFNGNGVYISLEGNQIKWDETLWGEEPDGWNEITVDTESCLYKYAGSCYNQYDACMQILQDEDYQTYKAYQAAQSSSNSQYGNQQNAATQQQATLKDFLGCAEVTPVYGGNAYVQQQSAYAQQKQYDCYDGDENCQRYNEYQQKLYYYSQQKSQSRRYFIGPSCGSNGRDISLAVYSDEYCSVLDSSSKVDDVLGYAPYSSSINLMPTECMACLVDENAEPWYEDEAVYALQPMCSMLYEYAGKCNKHLSAKQYNYDGYVYDPNYEYQNQVEDEQNNDGVEYADNEWKQMYQSENQAQNENAVCSYIESLTSNTYNEFGEIGVTGTNWASPSSWNRQFSSQSRAMNGGLKAALSIMALAAFGMSIAVCIFHSVLARRNIPWKPRRSKGQDPTDLARQNSGITTGRSRSGPSSNPLL